MDLKEKINNDLKEAMKSGDKLRLETVRSIRALILEFEKSGRDKVITKDVEIQMLTSAAKKRKEAIEQFRNANRNELADKEEAELKIIETYLPKKLTDDEIMAEVKKIAEEINAATMRDFPKLMPAAVKALKGQAEGGVIKNIVQKILSDN
ncbi:MAG: GatB/YqeY domain-containing protein [Melioribacteraceae bacterium]|nr:GatB/YqeY domain-containing protein [Melioribacteraceae bacterium]MCF8352945.1 GatB/YqeY domain-containing protein [Melioribacteraceae bacterium]MCF8395881.1 GatB/YqeY domain-containing protein [Melioribacteraceae bacterium]MCF8417462.1 GatB/YqeY domain-containing protein [Melioribacteraceae bacterium]